jgi:hypothetical protein
MRITSIIISAYSLWLNLFFDLLYLVVKHVPAFSVSSAALFACAARDCMIFSLLCSISTSFVLIEVAPSSGGRFVDASAASFFISLQLLRCNDAGGVVILLDQSSKFT